MGKSLGGSSLYYYHIITLYLFSFIRSSVPVASPDWQTEHKSTWSTVTPSGLPPFAFCGLRSSNSILPILSCDAHIALVLVSQLNVTFIWAIGDDSPYFQENSGETMSNLLLSCILMQILYYFANVFFGFEFVCIFSIYYFPLVSKKKNEKKKLAIFDWESPQDSSKLSVYIAPFT